LSFRCSVLSASTKIFGISFTTFDISFTNQRCSILDSFLNFPVENPILSMSDANWGPQDASQTIYQMIYLYSFPDLSAFHIDILGPFHWLSKCQKVTMCSSTKAEIYATNECVKFLLKIEQ
jgi:hypothetical protein